jgi:hypothetical protein
VGPKITHAIILTPGFKEPNLIRPPFPAASELLLFSGFPGEKIFIKAFEPRTSDHMLGPRVRTKDHA